MGRLDLLVVPVGGGGLIAGSYTALRGLQEHATVIGVEPEGSEDTRFSLAAETAVTLPSVPQTIAYGLQPVTRGVLTLEVNRQVVDRIVVVSDDEIRVAMRYLFERLKVIVEPSSVREIRARTSREATPTREGPSDGRDQPEG